MSGRVMCTRNTSVVREVVPKLRFDRHTISATTLHARTTRISTTAISTKDTTDFRVPVAKGLNHPAVTAILILEWIANTVLLATDRLYYKYNYVGANGTCNWVIILNRLLIPHFCHYHTFCASCYNSRMYILSRSSCLYSDGFCYDT